MEEVGWTASLKSCVAINGAWVAGTEDQDLFYEELYTYVNRYACAAHLFWGHWAIIQARYSPIDFDFLTYARQRLEGYTYHKHQFFPSNGH